MNTFAVVLLCIQACLVQNVFGQSYLGAYGPTAARFGCGAGLAGLAYPGLAGAYPAAGFASAYPIAGFAGAYPATSFAGAYPAAGCGAAAPYGGAGEGNVAVAGELPVAGTTAVAGQVPIMGAVSFSGPVAAAGAVSIAGKCACGCNAPYNYII